MFSDIWFTVPLFVVFATIIVLEFWKFYLKKTKLRPFRQLEYWPSIVLKMIGRNNEQIFEMFTTDTEEMSYTWAGPIPVFHAARPEDFQTILMSDKCLQKAFPWDFLNNRTGLATAKLNVWKEHKRALNPTLSAKMVTTFVPIFNEKFQKMADLMERQIGNSVDMEEIMFNASIDTIMSTSFGVNCTMQNRRGNEIHETIMYLMESIQKRLQRVWLWTPIYNLTQAYKMEMAHFHAYYQFMRAAFENKKMDLAEKLEHGVDELAIAKENNTQNYLQKCLQLQLEQKWSNENVWEEMDTIFVGSVDTSATTLCGIALMLAIHQEYQERVVNEMREIFNDAYEPVTNDHVSQMTFLELVIKESIRHFPIAPIMGRECTADLEINGGIIPKYSHVFLNALRMHKNPKFYGHNAHEFYPERFLPENCANWHAYQFIPFGAGPRRCIGERYAWVSLKIALAHIFRRFKLTTDLKLHEVIIKPELLLKIGNKNAIRIEYRKW